MRAHRDQVLALGQALCQALKSWRHPDITVGRCGTHPSVGQFTAKHPTPSPITMTQKLKKTMPTPLTEEGPGSPVLTENIEELIWELWDRVSSEEKGEAAPE